MQAIDNSFKGSTFAKSSFTINTDGSLPVTLSSYTVVAEGKKARIQWTTAAEQNNSRFDVMRSANGRDFTKLAAVEGKGTTSSKNQYSVYDNAPVNGMNYYKLLQVNTDGKVTDMGIRTLDFSNGSKPVAVVYPNPVRSDIGLSLSNFNAESFTATLSDMSGRVLHQEVISTGNGQGYYKLNLRTRPQPGQYVLLVTGNGLKQSLKVIVK